MTARRVSDFLQQLRYTLGRRGTADHTDGQLLEEFLARREEAAVAALVGRHGPMVWGVCRRVLRNHHDAEDAFQATFLVLVRRAADVQPPAMVANWLYGVAYQTALKARSLAARRHSRERQVSIMPEPATPTTEPAAALDGLLDQELHRLPDKYRVVLLLCDLEGKTRQEAAGHLGWPEGTVAGRLARARALLAKRLARHGLAAAGTALVGILPTTATATMPEAVATATIESASLTAVGNTAAAAIPAQVALLSECVLKALVLGKGKFLAVTLACLLGGGAMVYLHSGPAPKQGTNMSQAATASGTAAAAIRNPSPPVWQHFVRAHLVQIHKLLHSLKSADAERG